MTIHATKPMELTVVKLKDRKTVSIRDYQVEKALNQEKDIIIYHKTRHMRIPTDEIIARATPSGQFAHSKYDYRRYELIDFEWRPEA